MIRNVPPAVRVRRRTSSHGRKGPSVVVAVGVAVLLLAACTDADGGNASLGRPGDLFSTPPPPTTEVVEIYPFDGQGNLTADFEIRDLTSERAVDCSENLTPTWAIDPGIHRCVPETRGAHTCWAEPGTEGQLLCIADPWDRELNRVRAEGIGETPPAEFPGPFGMELEDGSRWVHIRGSARVGRSDGFVVRYVCFSPGRDCPYEGPGEVYAVLGIPGSPTYDDSTQPWTVRVGEVGRDFTAEYPPPRRLEVRTAWYIANPPVEGA